MNSGRSGKAASAMPDRKAAPATEDIQPRHGGASPLDALSFK
jgi:hypothetical protein